jgi:MFS family permease
VTEPVAPPPVVQPSFVQPSVPATAVVEPSAALTVAVGGRTRTVPVLAAAQVLGGVAVASGIAVNGLLAQDLSGSTALSGLAQTMGVLGAALLAVPLARLAGARGRRPALATGYAVGTVGAVLSLVAAQTRAFPLLLVGAALFGGGTASGLQARYAAIDGVGAAHRGRALSLVVWAATVGSVAGPNLSGPGGRLGAALGLPPLAGPYLFSVAAFALAAAVLWALLRPDPLAAALAAAPSGMPSGSETGTAEPPRRRSSRTWLALHAVRRSPGAALGLAAVGIAHAVMVAVMVMTPVHLHDAGATLEVVGVVISLHIAGMYALSPVMGLVADRFGRRAGIGLGVGVLASACLLAATSPAHAHARLAVALVLLGVGWSACVVAGSTLLSESVPADVRTSVQGLSDLVMGLVAASAGALAGPVVQGPGYGVLAVAALGLLLPLVALLLRSRSRPLLRA